MSFEIELTILFIVVAITEVAAYIYIDKKLKSGDDNER